ncbi:MAG: tRNA 2-selenouridine(34) synthase MnmH, partial [Candidatus Cloacimonadota bacterium]|nr:tRNA 2-selenouridine(34) synthase MnmH [Candidatus Cloacimonadota bacterium]
MKEINEKKLLELQNDLPVIDVRSPIEFAKGHIVGAKNIPLFTNEQRADVGTRYKKINRENALVKGLEYFATSAKKYLEKVYEITDNDEVVVYCWRGGSRSLAICKFLEAVNIKTYRLVGGYKQYRKFSQSYIEKIKELVVLSGYTGSGKTEKLIGLRKAGYQVINLEGLANHFGSAFGSINRGEQPSTEQFQNKLFSKLFNLDLSKPIWVEDESRMIGKVHINESFYKAMRNSKVVRINIPDEDRLKRLVNLYSDTDKETLKEVFSRIKKRLGAVNYQNAISMVDNSNYYGACKIALDYYDKAY